MTPRGHSSRNPFRDGKLINRSSATKRLHQIVPRSIVSCQRARAWRGRRLSSTCKSMAQVHHRDRSMRGSSPPTGSAWRRGNLRRAFFYQHGHTHGKTRDFRTIGNRILDSSAARRTQSPATATTGSHATPRRCCVPDRGRRTRVSPAPSTWPPSVRQRRPGWRRVRRNSVS